MSADAQSYNSFTAATPGSNPVGDANNLSNFRRFAAAISPTFPEYTGIDAAVLWWRGQSANAFSARFF
jgi:hypothetical protein